MLCGRTSRWHKLAWAAADILTSRRQPVATCNYAVCKHIMWFDWLFPTLRDVHLQMQKFCAQPMLHEGLCFLGCRPAAAAQTLLLHMCPALQLHPRGIGLLLAFSTCVQFKSCLHVECTLCSLASTPHHPHKTVCRSILSGASRWEGPHSNG